MLAWRCRPRVRCNICRIICIKGYGKFCRSAGLALCETIVVDSVNRDIARSYFNCSRCSTIVCIGNCNPIGVCRKVCNSVARAVDRPCIVGSVPCVGIVWRGCRRSSIPCSYRCCTNRLVETGRCGVCRSYFSFDMCWRFCYGNSACNGIDTLMCIPDNCSVSTSNKILE